MASSKRRSDSIARWFSRNSERGVDNSMSIEDASDSHDDVDCGCGSIAVDIDANDGANVDWASGD